MGIYFSDTHNIAEGAGAASRHSIGNTVLGGMLANIIFATLLVPAFYMMIQSLREKLKGQKQTAD